MNRFVYVVYRPDDEDDPPGFIVDLVYYGDKELASGLENDDIYDDDLIVTYEIKSVQRVKLPPPQPVPKVVLTPVPIPTFLD